MAKKKENIEEEKQKTCDCGEDCTCGCNEGEDCTCEQCTCDECEGEKNEYLELAQRIQADFDNYRKRSDGIVKQARQDGIIQATEKFLPAIDNFEKAKTMITDENTKKGIQMIEDEILHSLKMLDIEEIEAKGKSFDPKLHNVVAVSNDNSLDEGIITDVFQAGYKLKDRVIRYSQVVVNKPENKN